MLQAFSRRAARSAAPTAAPAPGASAAATAPDNDYLLVEFADESAASDFLTYVEAALNQPVNAEYRVGRTRAIVWRGARPGRHPVLYVTGTATALAQSAAVPFVIVGRGSRATLPDDREVILGSESASEAA